MATKNLRIYLFIYLVSLIAAMLAIRFFTVEIDSIDSITPVAVASNCKNYDQNAMTLYLKAENLVTLTNFAKLDLYAWSLRDVHDSIDDYLADIHGNLYVLSAKNFVAKYDKAGKLIWKKTGNLKSRKSWRPRPSKINSGRGRAGVFRRRAFWNPKF